MTSKLKALSKRFLLIPSQTLLIGMRTNQIIVASQGKLSYPNGEDSGNSRKSIYSAVRRIDLFANIASKRLLDTFRTNLQMDNEFFSSWHQLYSVSKRFQWKARKRHKGKPPTSLLRTNRSRRTGKSAQLLT